jgi:hypothetical protein
MPAKAAMKRLKTGSALFITVLVLSNEHENLAAGRCF